MNLYDIKIVSATSEIVTFITWNIELKAKVLDMEVLRS